jgi:hypothetical protein
MLIFIVLTQRALRFATICTAVLDVLCAITGSYAKRRCRS